MMNRFIKYMIPFVTGILFINPAYADMVCNKNIPFVNVRSGPSAKKFPIIDQISNGQAFMTLQVYLNKSKKRWTFIEYEVHSEIRTGWIYSENICPEDHYEGDNE